jgi:prepilin-type N-terminal cleavage/methylation domain-containing protein
MIKINQIKGFTLVELCIVVAISSLVFAGVVQLLSSTRREVKRGSDTMKSQVLIERIVSSLRNDIRSLRNLIQIKNNSLELEVIRENGSDIIKYSFKDGILTRFAPDSTRRLNAKNEIAVLKFIPRPDSDNFQYLEMALRVASDEAGPNIKGKKMSIISHFFPYCKEIVPLYGQK